MQELDRITVILCDTRSYAQGLHSLTKTLSEIKPARTIFFTDVDLPEQDGIEIIKISPIKSKVEYSSWIMKELWKYIATDFVLVTQWDGYVINGSAWLDEFYEYDYVASPWIYEHGRNIGNGGFCLKSKRLCEILGTDPFIEILHPEDQSLGILYRGYLEQKYNIRFPDEELADKFAFELKTPVYDTFGFHQFFHKPHSDTIIIKRSGAMGDCIMCEPILSYFFNKGFRVVFDTPNKYFNLFIQHYFKIHHRDELDGRLLPNARVINLDMAYEINPTQLHLRTYYQMCGILDGEIRNPRLWPGFDAKDPRAKLFKKYVVLHIDQRPQKGRNVYGVDWNKVVNYLHSLKYDVIQIGQADHETVEGAIEMTNINEIMLMRLIGGADCFIGIDSGPANISVAMETKSIVFFGSVDPLFIYPDLTNVQVIQYENVCRLPKCWHSKIGTEGVECVEIEGKQKYKVQAMQGSECIETEDIPPCVRYTTKQIIEAIDKMINQ